MEKTQPEKSTPKRIKEIIELTPIISTVNVREFLRQATVKHYKKYGIPLNKKSIQHTVEKDFREHFLPLTVGAFVSTNIDNRMVLCLKNIEYTSKSKYFSVNNKKPDITLEEKFLKNICYCLSHETMHKVLELNENDKTSEYFDYIYYKHLKNYGVAMI